MPNERFYAIRNTREFLVELMDPKKTPRVPKEIRLKAYYAIKHFPGEYHMEEARKLVRHQPGTKKQRDLQLHLE